MHKIGDKIKTIKYAPCIHLKSPYYKMDNIIRTDYFDINSKFRIIKVVGDDIYFQNFDNSIYYMRMEFFDEFFTNIRKNRREKLQIIFKKYEF